VGLLTFLEINLWFLRFGGWNVINKSTEHESEHKVSFVDAPL